MTTSLLYADVTP